jgi:hypothetical protein
VSAAIRKHGSAVPAYGLRAPSGRRSNGSATPFRAYPPSATTMTARSPSDTKADGTREARQLLHLVFGGELKSLEGVEFSDISALDVVGIFPNYAEAYKAWKAAAQKTVDNAQMRYFIVHMHRLLDPELTGPPKS